MKGKKPTKRSAKKERAAAKGASGAAAPVSAHPETVRAADLMRREPAAKAVASPTASTSASSEADAALDAETAAVGVVGTNGKGPAAAEARTSAAESPKAQMAESAVPGAADAASPAAGKASEKPAEGEGEVAAAEPKRHSAEKRKARLPRPSAKKPFVKWPLAVAGAVLMVFLLVVGLFAWQRWGRYDDAADIQGTWYAAGTDTPIVITADGIQLNAEVSYEYALDTGAKTLVFSFADLQGGGWYRFSLDRQQLAILDGTYFWTDTLFPDFGYTASALFASMQGAQLPPFEGEGVTLLSRRSASDIAAEQQAGAESEAGGVTAAESDASAASSGDAGAGSSAGDPEGEPVDGATDVPVDEPAALDVSDHEG